MKKFLGLLILILPIAGFCQANKALPYVANYSSNFKISESNKYVALVLNATKAFEDNNFDGISSWVADTINVEMADGSKIKGKQNFINAGKQIRGEMSELKVTLDAFMGVHSVDRGEEIVLLWLTNTATIKGQKASLGIHQVWIFNKAGQLAFFKDFIDNTNNMSTKTSAR
jgi:hypothetical protein